MHIHHVFFLFSLDSPAVQTLAPSDEGAKGVIGILDDFLQVEFFHCVGKSNREWKRQKTPTVQIDRIV